MYINPLNDEVQQNNSSLQSQNSDETGKESIFMLFNDDNNIVEKTDIQFANKTTEEIATPYLTFLNKYCDGKHNWTTALLDLVKYLIDCFNDSYKDYQNQIICSNTYMKEKNGCIKFKVNINDSGILRIQHRQKEISYDTIYEYKDGNIESYYTEIIPHNIKRSINAKTYRKDGSLKSEKIIKDSVKIVSNYNSNEILTKKTTESESYLIKERFKENRSCKEVYNKLQIGLNETLQISSRIIYEDDTELLRTDYENNKVINFIDNRKNEEKPIFDKNKLNGKFDNPIKQGFSGICYMVGIANSMILSDNKDNLKDLDECVSYDTEKEIGTVTFKGLNRTYSFPLSEIEKHMARLGTEDPDFPLMALGYEKYLAEENSENSIDNIEKNISLAKNDDEANCLSRLKIKPPKSKTIDSGLPNDFYFAITGKEMKKKILDDNSFQQAKKFLNNGGIVNAGTVKESNEDDEFMNNHNYSVIKIDDENVTVLEPNHLKEITCPIEKFKKRFESIFYN